MIGYTNVLPAPVKLTVFEDGLDPELLELQAASMIAQLRIVTLALILIDFSSPIVMRGYINGSLRTAMN
jgi:hypothetical protein